MTRPRSMPLADSRTSHSMALLLIDVINDFDFPEADTLIALAEQAAPRIEALAQRARHAGVPVIYVNDNFGDWRSDFRSTVSRCSDPSRRGAAIVRRLLPQQKDFFVLKPMHSGFFCTPLELLLAAVKAKSVVLCGFATNSCVTFTAHDAHMRGFSVFVPRDATAANTAELGEQALSLLETTVHADTRPSDAISFESLAADGAAAT